MLNGLGEVEGDGQAASRVARGAASQAGAIDDQDFGPGLAEEIGGGAPDHAGADDNNFSSTVHD